MRKIVIHPTAPPETGYWVECPSLGIASQGETIDEAIAMIREAIDLWIEVALEDGDPIPPEDITEEIPITLAV